MTITRVGVATGTTTATVPAHAIGDLIIIAAYRNTTGTPALPAGYQSILTKTGTTSSMRVGFKIATATNDASGTWTNATALVCHVYRSSNYATGSSLYIGGSASNSATVNTVNYPALTMTHADNTSWALGFVGVSNLTETIATAPSGMTNQSHETAAATQAAGHDTNGTVSSWSSTNVVTTGTAGNSVSATVELIENQAGTAITNFVQHWAYPYTISNADPNSYDQYTYIIDPTLSGNGLVLVVAYPSGSTPAITDDKSNTWPTSGGTGTVTADAGAGNMALQSFVLTSATTGTSQIVVSFGGNPKIPVKVWITQLFNITGTINGSVHAAAVNTGGIVSPGAFTPTNNNANGGNLVLSYMIDSALIGNASPKLIVPESHYSLNDADIGNLGNTTCPSASQFQLQAASAATTPRFYLNTGATETYNVIAFALSVGVQGTAKPSGAGVAPWIDRVCFFGSDSSANPWLLQIPSTGNCGVLMSFLNAQGVQTSASATDSDGTSWTKITSTNGGATPFLNQNQTPKSNRTIGVAITGSGNLQLAYYDISNAATTGQPVANASGVFTGTSNTGSIANQPSITPTGTNQLTLCLYSNTFGPTMFATSPIGNFFDAPTAFCAKFTATIAATSMTVSATTWGAVQINGNVISGSGVTVGTSVQSGAGPFTIQPSQTVSGATVMLEDGGDFNTLNFGNAFCHFFNGASTAAQNWTFALANVPSSTGQGNAIILAGPPAGATATWGWSPRTYDNRLLPISRLPDQGALWFLPSPDPVPTNRWLPTTGADRERLPPIQRTDWALQWFVQSPDPVPTTWLPTTGEEDRPRRIDPSPDQVIFVRQQAAAARAVVWLPTTGEEDRPSNPNRIRSPDEPFPFFIRSTAPVPTTWLPVANTEVPRSVPIFRVDDHTTYFASRGIASPLAGLLWFAPPDQPPQLLRIEPYTPPFFRPQLAAPVGISGMAWWRPVEVLTPPPPPQGDYHAAWDPQFVVQITPPSTGIVDWIVRARRRGRR